MSSLSASNGQPKYEPHHMTHPAPFHKHDSLRRLVTTRSPCRQKFESDEQSSFPDKPQTPADHTKVPF